MEFSRNVGNGTVPTPSPSDVTTNAATTHVATEYPIPVKDGLAVGTRARFLSLGVGRMALAVLCLSPVVVTLYDKAVSYAPMEGEEGTFSSDAWQRDVPSGFRTKRRGETLAFYALDTADDRCERMIGSAPGLARGPLSVKDGWITGSTFDGGRSIKITAWRDRGKLALSYDEDDPWVFFTRGAPPKRTVTVRFHQIDTRTCSY